MRGRNGGRMKISYAITVCDEVDEFIALHSAIVNNKHIDDEIVVLVDTNRAPEDFIAYLDSLLSEGAIQRLLNGKFDGKFDMWKNLLNNGCDGEFIFQIDADETPNPVLILKLRDIIDSMGSTTDLIYVPRINVVAGLTDDHIKKWGWNVTEHFGLPCVNFPDPQGRIYRNAFNIKWHGAVHERIIGYRHAATLPFETNWCLYHHKTIEKQENQNSLYDTLSA
jgi:hypothetical protein